MSERRSAIRDLFKAAGGPEASVEQVQAAALANPNLYQQALRELLQVELRKVFAHPRLDFRGFGGHRGGALTDVPVTLDDESASAADSVRNRHARGDAGLDEHGDGPATRAIRRRRARRSS